MVQRSQKILQSEDKDITTRVIHSYKLPLTDLLARVVLVAKSDQF